MNIRQIFTTGATSRRGFRHDGGAMRATSALTAAAMVALLVLGTSPAMADDTAPAPAAADSATPGGDATAEPTPTDPPADETAADPAPDPAAEPAPPAAEAPAAPAEAPAAEPKVARAQSSASSSSAALAGTTIDVPCSYNSPDAVAVPAGKFEIDGNTCLTGDPTTPAAVVGNEDWDSLTYADPEHGDVAVDGLGDSSGFTLGASETDDPLAWGGGHQPNAKNDIETGWGYSQSVGGKVFGYFGFTSGSQAGGTQQVNMEYNQKDPVLNNAGNLAVPDRTPGDLLFHFAMNGSAPLDFTDVLVWTQPGGSLPGNCTAVGGYSPAAGWCPIDGVSDALFHSAVSADGQFAEGSIEISGLPIFDNKCSGEFGTMQMRTTTGGSWTSALKDYVGPLAVNTPSSCGKIRIEKRNQDGDLVGGATFTVSSDPNTHADDFDVTDNQAPDENPAPGIIEISGVEPGQTFTVTEKTPPPSPTASEWPKYENTDPLGDGPNPQTVGTGETKTFTFTNILIWAPLDASKTAAGAYDAKYNWKIEKLVKFGDGSYGPTATGTSSSTSAPFDYQVKAGQDGAPEYSNATLSGSVKVNNPNGLPVQVNLADEFPNFSCTFPGGATPLVPANAVNQAYAYTCTPDNAAAKPANGNNTATVEWSKANYPQNKADASAAPSARYEATTPAVPVVFAEHATDKTVTVTDNKYVFDPAWTLVGNDAGTVTETRTYTRTVTGTSGTCVEDTNTAKVVNGGTTLAQDSATATLCVGQDLEVTKTATGSFTRTYLWNIRKVPCNTENADMVTACDLTTPKFPSPASPTYTVEVTKNGGPNTTGYQMGGTISVKNPNDWESITPTAIVDDFLGSTGEDCEVTTPLSAIAAGQTKVFNYVCTFEQATPPVLDGINKATVTWDKDAASTPGSSASGQHQLNPDTEWTETSINKTVYVYDLLARPGETPALLGTVTWTPDFVVKYFHPTHSELVSDPGACKTYTDTAWLSGTDDPEATALDADSASVIVCDNKGLQLSGDATTTFTRTYGWTVDKQIWDEDTQDWAADDSESVTGDSFDHDFTYRVAATKDAGTDSGWLLTGSVTIKNLNSDGGIADIHATVTQPGTVGGVPATCQARIHGSGDPFQGTAIELVLASGDSVTLDVKCSFTEAPAAASTYAASVTTSDPTTGSTTVNVPFSTPTTLVNDSVTVVDDKATADTSDDTEYGPISQSTVFGEYTLKHTATTTGCSEANTWINTARLVGQDPEFLGAPDSTEAAICPIPGTWNVWKTSDPASGPSPEAVVLPGQEITYTLHAKKIAGVDPTGVVVLDELGGLLPYVDMPVDLPAGVTWLDGDTLKWDVGTLSDGVEKTVTFTVTVKATAVGVTMPNLITSEGSESCPPPSVEKIVAMAVVGPEESEAFPCDTVHYTPRYTLQKSSDRGATVLPGDTITYKLEVKNVSGVVLPGFTVSDDLSDVLDDATIVEADLDPELSLSGNTLTWHHAGDVAPGATEDVTYTVTVKAHQWGATLHNQATPKDKVGECVIDPETEDELCDTTTKTPSATGQLTVVAKRQFLFNGTDWVEVPNGTAVGFGQEVKYKVTVRAVGPKAFRNVVASDFLPGFNTDEAPGTDLTTQAATLVPGTIKCGGDFADASLCQAGINGANLVTWKLGAVEGSDRVIDAGLNPDFTPKVLQGDMEFNVIFPTLPDPVPYPADGVYRQTVWNIGYLDWDGGLVQSSERLAGASAARTALAPTAFKAHALRSNAVFVSAAAFEPAPPIVEPPAPAVLPATGGPDRSLVGLGFLLALVGSAVVVFDRRRQRRS